MSVSERGEEAGGQSLDSMNKNCVERHGMPDKLATDSKVQKGLEQSHVNAARVRGKLSHLIRGDLSKQGQESAEAIVVGGWGNSSTGRRAERTRRGTEGRCITKQPRLGKPRRT